jgi:hypothetical protein
METLIRRTIRPIMANPFIYIYNIYKISPKLYGKLYIKLNNIGLGLGRSRWEAHFPRITLTNCQIAPA